MSSESTMAVGGSGVLDGGFPAWRSPARMRLSKPAVHEGPKQTIATVLRGTTWRQCRVPFFEESAGRRAEAPRDAIGGCGSDDGAQPDPAIAMISSALSDS
jgi:hypothetical protein